MKFASYEPNRIRIFRCSCVKNFRESYVFHCLVIKVICLCDSFYIISADFHVVKNFFIYFSNSFSTVRISNSDIISYSFISVNNFFNFFSFNFVSEKIEIRLIQKRIYHTIVFRLRQAPFYIYLHLFFIYLFSVKYIHKDFNQNILIIQII